MVTAIADHGKIGEIYNIGSGKPISMNELLKQILTKHNLDLSCVGPEDLTLSRSLNQEIPAIYADISKTQKLMKRKKG